MICCPPSVGYDKPMQAGALIDEEGTLLRDGDSVFLRREAGGRYQLDMRRAPIVLSDGRVRIIGVYVAEDLIDVSKVVLV